ncbi:hypothetical protein CHLNCDRAFT_51586 [Chlorella variabilis]|uniref:Splicing factor ESS-2 homolog n=1 Tax=Chlorella variabilis TaxID=554065 RepID=E1ZB81_CHLVA|nr:hypothetical protein CHLNCDRAFT_51586 [Chlorella variabilis]EFN56811.1 hypothetical protein CHLNCDRAFT_51586 [Chlorella variabilis]|eukprot:XP_005848913.1 hypothetical protein CHLNCDRAFT_51586 [Chlorella variabilis]
MASGQPTGQLAAGGGGLMLPPPPRAPKRQQVLDEEEYCGTMEALIERDFFPELPKLESKIAWLQAIRSGQPEQIRQAQLMIAQRRAAAAAGATPAGAPLFTPGGTAARAIAGDTPYIPVLPLGMPLREARPATGGSLAAVEEEEEEEEGAGVVVPPPVSLDTFLAHNTGEDNASFQELLEQVNKKRRLRVAEQLAQQPDPTLLITDGRERTDGFGTTGQQPDTLVLWKYEPKNTLYYDSSQREALPYSGAELAAMVQGPAKSINHAATRFPKDPAASASATPSASTAGGAAGPAAGAAAAAAGGGTRGYSILAPPQFDPGAEGTPFMTWGDIDATPMRIEAEDLPPGGLMEGPSFYIKEGTRKEKAAQQLAHRAGASLRKKQGMRGGTPLVSGALAAAAAARRQATGAPLTGSRGGRPATAGGQQPRGKPLSAAAQRLASSMHRKQPGADMGLRASYRGATPGTSRRPGTGARPASSAGGSTWGGAAAPSRGWTPAGTPQPPHATLEEEEARVQAVLRQRHKEAEQRRQLEEAREAAKQAFQPELQRPAPVVPAAQPAAGGQGADLTAGLLNI